MNNLIYPQPISQSCFIRELGLLFAYEPNSLRVAMKFKLIYMIMNSVCNTFTSLGKASASVKLEIKYPSANFYANNFAAFRQV